MDEGVQQAAKACECSVGVFMDGGMDGWMRRKKGEGERKIKSLEGR